MTEDAGMGNALACQIGDVLIPACHWFYLDERVRRGGLAVKNKCKRRLARVHNLEDKAQQR